MKAIELVYLLGLGGIILLFTPLFTLLIQAGIMMCYGFAGGCLHYRHCMEGIRRLKTEHPIAAEHDKAL